MAKNGKNNSSGELEVSGYFETGWRGEGEEEVPEKKNLAWLIILTIAVFGVLYLRTTYLQIVKGSFYKAQAEENRIRKIYVDAPRGFIYDRNKKVLTTNIPQFDLEMIPGLIPKDPGARGSLFSQITSVIQVGMDEMESAYKGAKSDSFSPVVLKEDIPREKALNFEIESAKWQGIILSKKAKRSYENSEITAHFLGFTGKINEQELKSHPDYLLTDSIGKDGLEESYESILRGTKGSQQLEVDSTGKVKRQVGNASPVKGEDLVLSLDIDLQREAYASLQEKIQETGSTGGAAVAIDPRSGSILALASYPSYNDNEFVGKISQDRLREISQEGNRPLFNRAVAGMYPPGSTFKPVVAAGALDKKIVTGDEVLDCPAVLQVGQWQFADWKYHGMADLNKAIAESVNTYFYIVGGGWGDRKGLGPDNIAEYARLFGLGQKTGIDIPQESTGLVPDPDWKQKNKNEAWYIGDTYHYSIGQGDLLVTPLQMANYISAVVNGGTLYKPHFVDSVENSEGEVVNKIKPEAIKQKLLPANVLSAVRLAMGTTVSSETGSARALQVLEQKYNIKIGGKTGTAESGEEEKYHAWFVGFAPLDNPEIVLAVIVEKGGEGYSSAMPVAQRMLDVYFGKR
ncbi:MAG: penicillin-binding protein 2 [Candidatus Moraniibacteriota bacterium]